MKLTKILSTTCILSLLIVANTAAVAKPNSDNWQRMGIATSHNTMDASKIALKKAGAQIGTKLACAIDKGSNTITGITTSNSQAAKQPVC